MSSYESTIIVNAVTSSVSAIACILMIASYFILKELRTYSYKLIAIQVGFDLGRCLVNFFPTYDMDSSDFLCQVQAFALQLFTCCSVVWTGVIATSIFLCTVKLLPDIERFHYIFLAVTFSFGLLSSLPPIITANYGRSVSWCWIEPKGLGDYWILLNTHLVYLVVQVYNLILYIFIIRSVRQTESSYLSNKKKKQIIARMIWYPVILAVCLLPIGVYRVYQVSGGKDNYIIVNIGMIFLNSNGLANSIKYSTTDTVRNAVRRRLFNVKDTFSINTSDIIESSDNTFNI